MQPNLLTQVALTVGSRQGENVATAALVHILSTSPTGRDAAVAHLSALANLDFPAGLAFSSQVGRTTGGIADAVATDEGKIERIIIESTCSAAKSPGNGSGKRCTGSAAAGSNSQVGRRRARF